jgi:hypothetical protein
MILYKLAKTTFLLYYENVRLLLINLYELAFYPLEIKNFRTWAESAFN